MSQVTVLGIHSNVNGSAGYVDGHAWITVTSNGITEYYGLWPDNHPATSDNGEGTDIRVGMEQYDTPEASRYYRLSAAQEKLLDKLLMENVEWGYTHNCSSWAHEVIWKTVREDVDADDYLWAIETPRELGRNIAILENKSPTNIHKPKDMRNQQGSSSTSIK